MRLTARTAGKCKVALRIPGWCTKAHVWVNYDEVKDVKSGYLTLDRTWNEGDAVTLRFDLPVVAHVNAHHVAFTRGPILLARDSRYGAGDLGEVIRNEFKDGETVEGALLVRSPTPAIAMTVTVPLQIGSHSENPLEARPSQVSFCDYASAGNAWTPENPYRTWFPLEQHPWD